MNTRLLPWLRQHPAFSVAVAALLVVCRLLYQSDRTVSWGMNFLFTFALILWLNIARKAPSPADIAAHPELSRITERHWLYFLLFAVCAAALLVLCILSRL